MQSLDPLFARLSRSKFRSRFRLGVKERQYCLEKGAPVIEQHAADFVAKRHNIAQGEALSEEQQRYIVTVIYHWLVIQMNQP